MAERPRRTRPERAGPGPRERGIAEERERAVTRELVEFETATEGSTGEPKGESGTLPGSVGGATGTAGRTPGVQTPGASSPGFPGISPERARKLRGAKRRRGGGR